MKNIILYILTCVSTFVAVVCVIAFVKIVKSPENVDGDFIYTIFNDNAYIEGLSEKGMEKEIITIPEKIKGYDVVSLKSYSYSDKSPNISFKSEKLRIVIITKPLLEIPKYRFYDCINLEKILYIGNDKMYVNKTFETLDCDDKPIYIYGINYDDETNEVFKKANISYYNDDKLYYADYVLNTIVKDIPFDPVKKGYKFEGWYIDKECTSKYDFKQIITTDLTLYAKWGK